MKYNLEFKNAVDEIKTKSKHMAALANCFSFSSDHNVQTACVEFSANKGNPLQLKFNPEFWDSLNQQERCAIISHEIMHIILNHGQRMLYNNNQDIKIQNIAMDICVNEILKCHFNIDEKYAPILKNGVYAEKISKELSKERCYEYYYRFLKQNPESIPNSLSIDSHEWMKNFSELSNSQKKEIIKNITNTLKKSGMTQYEIKKFLENMRMKYSSTGTQPGHLEKILDGSESEIKRQTSWQKVLKKIKKVFEEKYNEDDNWILKQRRNFYESDFLIPSNESKIEKTKKRHIHIFMDTSGSCGEWAETFMGSSLAFPKDNFELSLYCFDTEVYEIDKQKPHLKGFGGTSFKCISDYINNKIDKYDCIIVLTDGYGDNAIYKRPNLWHWILTSDFIDFIPKKSKVYHLEDINIKA